jgi:hypothetical protein
VFQIRHHPSVATSRFVPDAGIPGQPRHALLEAGLLLVVVGVPLVFFPLSRGPFVDPKLVLLLGGALLVWLSGVRADRDLAIAAGAWVAVLAAASLAGVDPWISLAGPENLATGLLMLGAAGYLLAAGARLPRALADRLPAWLIGVGVAVSLVAIVYRIHPGVASWGRFELALDGGTLGQRVLLTGLLAAALSAVVGLKRARTPWLLAGLVVLSSGLALAAERSGWIAVAVGMAVAIRRSRIPARRALVVVGTVAAVLAAWTAADVLALPAYPVSAARRFGQITEGSAAARLDVLSAVGRGFTRKPVLGWGPGNTWSAYVSSATEEELESAGRGWGDSHNIVAETAVSAGVLGVLALLAMGAVVFRRIRRGPPAGGWAVGAAVALATNHLFQPESVALTPLLFLMAGVAAGYGSRPVRAVSDAPAREPFGGRLRVVGRYAVGAALGAGLAMSLLVMTASSLEQWGRDYNSAWSLRTALDLAPGRLSAAQGLAIHLAIDGRAGDAEAAAEARDVAARAVRLHPWSPSARLAAADVELLLGDAGAARGWVESHLERFPAEASSPAFQEFFRRVELEGDGGSSSV